MTKNNLAIIQERLTMHYPPTHWKVIDDSEKHRDHAGYQGGGRHFTIEIAANLLPKQSRIAAHRQIYALFADLIPSQIHALSIKIHD